MYRISRIQSGGSSNFNKSNRRTRQDIRQFLGAPNSNQEELDELRDRTGRGAERALGSTSIGRILKAIELPRDLGNRSRNSTSTETFASPTFGRQSFVSGSKSRRHTALKEASGQTIFRAWRTLPDSIEVKELRYSDTARPGTVLVSDDRTPGDHAGHKRCLPQAIPAKSVAIDTQKQVSPISESGSRNS